MTATRAREVIGADVEDDRMTCRKGCNNAGASNVLISLHDFKSLRNRVKADINGLSWMLFPFLPLNPHRLAKAKSPSAVCNLSEEPFLFPETLLRELGTGEAVMSRSLPLVEPLPPRMAATEECAQRACFRMAEVTVMHSVVTRDTGSTDIGRVYSDIMDGRGEDGDIGSSNWPSGGICYCNNLHKLLSSAARVPA